MSSTRSATIAFWFKVTFWSIAITLAALGIVLSVMSATWWPLLFFAALALPLFPIATPMAMRSRKKRKH